MVPYFIAGVSVTIIPWEEFVFLFDPHNRETFGMASQSGFSLNINFHSYESVASYIFFCILILWMLNSIINL